MSAHATPTVTSTTIRNLMREVPPLTSNDLAVMVRSWVERARAIAVEPDVGVVESYLWAAELSKLHGTANWQVLSSALNARVLRACGGVNDALSWPSLFLAQAVRAMKLQWAEDEQHVEIIRKWVVPTQPHSRRPALSSCATRSSRKITWR